MSDVGVQGDQESPVTPMEGSGGMDQGVSLETSSSTVGGVGGEGDVGEEAPGAVGETPGAEVEPPSLASPTEGGAFPSEIPVTDAVEEPMPAPAQQDLEQQQKEEEEEEQQQQEEQQAEETPVAEEDGSSPAPVVVEPEDEGGEEEEEEEEEEEAVPPPTAPVTFVEVVEDDSPPRPDNAQECIAVAATLPVYCPSDVARHASQDDAWVSLHGRVYNVTHLLQAGVVHTVSDCDMLMANAGKDVSPWFTPGGHRVKTFVDPVTNLVSPYLPAGRFPHVPPSGVPTTGWVPLSTPPWWQDPALVVGRLTARARRIRVVNTLTSHEHYLDVGCEQTITAIATKYLEYNAHSLGYTWKVLKPDYDSAILPLDMAKTLEENHVPDEGEEIDELGLDGEDSDLLPTILLYYSDELTMA